MSLLLGALLTFLAPIAVQRIIVPKVDARKRREERWERDVLALTELLTIEVPPLARSAQIATGVLQEVNLAVLVKDADPGRRDRLMREPAKGARASMDAYSDAIEVRGDGLADRIVRLDPTDPGLVRFENQWVLLSSMRAGLKAV